MPAELLAAIRFNGYVPRITSAEDRGDAVRGGAAGLGSAQWARPKPSHAAAAAGLVLVRLDQFAGLCPRDGVPRVPGDLQDHECVSLGVVASAIVVALGARIGDPIIGLLI